MTDPSTFDTATPRLGLPLLFPGQAQKEFYVNEAHALTDALLHGAIEGVADAPPSAPGEGECWLIGTAPTGSWAAQAGKIACRQLGNWLFVAPRDGFALLDRTSGQVLHYRGEWRAPNAPATPTGGSTIDTELRTAFASLLNALGEAGIFAS